MKKIHLNEKGIKLMIFRRENYIVNIYGGQIFLLGNRTGFQKYIINKNRIFLVFLEVPVNFTKILFQAFSHFIDVITIKKFPFNLSRMYIYVKIYTYETIRRG